MADDGKLGPTVSELIQSGFQDLRDANEGKMAMGAPPIEAPAPEAPAMEPGSYAAAIQAQRDMAEVRQEPSQDQEMSR